MGLFEAIYRCVAFFSGEFLRKQSVLDECLNSLIGDFAYLILSRTHMFFLKSISFVTILTSLILTSCGSNEMVSSDACHDIVATLTRCKIIPADGARGKLIGCKSMDGISACAAATEVLSKCMVGQDCDYLKTTEACAKETEAVSLDCDLSDIMGDSASKNFGPYLRGQTSAKMF